MLEILASWKRMTLPPDKRTESTADQPKFMPVEYIFLG